MRHPRRPHRFRFPDGSYELMIDGKVQQCQCPECRTRIAADLDRIDRILQNQQLQTIVREHPDDIYRERN